MVQAAAAGLSAQGRQFRTAGILARSFSILLIWVERARQRRDLRELEQYRLDDIGVTREQANAEAGKPFWRA
jgi:uncharacterized protein YjiS (DUF1127 family)